MSKPVIQVTNTQPLGGRLTENLQIEGNRVRPTQNYVNVWEGILTPRGGLEALLMESTLYTAGIGFMLSWGGWALLVCVIWVALYTTGGLLAVILEPKLSAPWYIREGFIALGFILSLL